MVVEAARLAAWLDVKDLTKVGLFRYDASSGAFTAIPFQIDKRRKIYINKNMNPTANAAQVDVCEYGYFREKNVAQGSSGDTFASDLLKATDEVVFLWKDAGDQAPRTQWLTTSGVELERYEITLTDTNNGGNRWVYAFVATTTPLPSSSTKYAKWTSDPNSQNCTNGLDSCGTAGGQNLPSGSTMQSVHFLKNWVADAYKTGTGSPFLGTLVSRFEFKMGAENEDTWSSQAQPVFVGVYTGERPVRIVRQIQGAQSGTHTTRYDFVYPSYYVSRVNLRVHPIPELYGRVRHDVEASRQSPLARIWTKTGFEKTTPVSRDTIDGTGPRSEQIDDTQAQYVDWTEIATPALGSYAQFFRERRSLVAAQESYTYQDKAAGFRYGVFGRYMNRIGLTQDGGFPPDYEQCPGCAINDGGCVTNDPESGNLNFARLEWTMLPLPGVTQPDDAGSVQGDDAYANFTKPVTLSARLQLRDYFDPTPPTPCIPSLAAGGANNNGIVDLNVNSSGCSSGTGFRVYRQTGSGPSLLFRDLRTSTALRDLTVRVGTTYTDTARAYNEVNTEGTASATLGVGVTDTVPPAVPFNLTVTPGSRQLTASWNGGLDRDIYGFDVWMSSDGGLNYAKVSADPVPAWADANWRQMNLQSGQSHCFKVAAVDVHGNASAPTSPVCGAPNP